MPNKTHEQFIKDFNEKNPNTNINIIGRYLKRNIKIQCECGKCNNVWEAFPGNLLSGHGCPICANNSHTLTIDEFNKKLHEKFPYIKLVSDFTKGKDPVKLQCDNCGNVWDLKVAISIFNTKIGCPNCAILSNKRTHDEFLEIIKEKSPNIEILSEYKGPDKKIKCKCNICNYIWSADARDLIKGSNCLQCFIKNMTKTHEQFLIDLEKINQNIEVLGKYISSKEKIECLCKICNYQWKATPNKLLLGEGCPKCSHHFITDEEFKQRVYKINKDVIILDKYIKGDIKVLCQCKSNSSHIWYANPGNLLSGTGCPLCIESKAEKKIRKFLDKNNIGYEQEYRFNDCRDKNPLPFDFYLEKYNLCIEYDGKQHYEVVQFTKDIKKAEENFKITQYHDNIKNNYCDKNDIDLLRISYVDYNNIDKILYDRLLKGGDCRAECNF